MKIWRSLETRFGRKDSWKPEKVVKKKPVDIYMEKMKEMMALKGK
jgi:hypothetical protein